jgi:AcrR family transcriptional regulator
VTGRVEQVRARAARGRRRHVLGVDAIVEQALRIVDTEGVQAVSMRRVAAEFDTGPASLYAHVANKEELLRLVLDRILDEVEIPTGDDWQQVVRSLAHNLRRTLQRHSDAAQLTFAHLPTGQRSLETVERLLSAMISGGVPPQVAAWSLDILSLYVGADVYEGWLMQQRLGGDPDPEAADEQMAGEAAATFAALPADRYPYLTAYRDVLMAGGGQERFAFGIDMLIAGFAAQIRSRPSAPPSGTP